MSKIPEGTQFIEAGCGEKGFRKFEKGCWWFFEGFWRHVDWKMGVLTLVTEHPSYVAPTTPWDGEGLPPVGTSCEMCGSGAWYLVKILGAGKLTALIEYDDGQEHAVPIKSVTFRPILTTEQFAARDRKIAIGEMIDIFKASPGLASQEGIAALYDAGYRKQVMS